jgi:hypothetical protein
MSMDMSMHTSGMASSSSMTGMGMSITSTGTASMASSTGMAGMDMGGHGMGGMGGGNACKISVRVLEVIDTGVENCIQTYGGNGKIHDEQRLTIR